MTLLTKEQQKSYQNAKVCYICKEIFEDKYVEDRKYYKIGDLCHYTWGYRGTAHAIWSLKQFVAKNRFS